MVDAMKLAREALEMAANNASLWDTEREQCDAAATAMSAAIEAAERAKDAQWTTSPLTYLTKTKEGIVFCNVVEMPAHAVEWQWEGAHPPAITADMVERAAIALHKQSASVTIPFADLPKDYKETLRHNARAALEAAWGAKHAE